MLSLSIGNAVLTGLFLLSWCLMPVLLNRALERFGYRSLWCAVEKVLFFFFSFCRVGYLLSYGFVIIAAPSYQFCGWPFFVHHRWSKWFCWRDWRFLKTLMLLMLKVWWCIFSHTFDLLVLTNESTSIGVRAGLLLPFFLTQHGSFCLLFIYFRCQYFYQFNWKYHFFFRSLMCSWSEVFF